jgi:hypothetical protein
MHGKVAALVVGGALVAATLGPVAQAAPPMVPTPATATAVAGADCEWGTEPAAAISPVAYPRGYLTGWDWLRDYPSPHECALGPAWTPVMTQYPFSKVIATGTVGSLGEAKHLCTGLADPTCSASDWGRLYAESAVGYCDADGDFNCVESLEVIDQSGTVQTARYVRGFPETVEIPEFDQGDLFMPAGGSVPLWEYDVPGGVARILSVGMTHATFRPEAGRWVKDSGSVLFSLTLRPTVIESRPAIPKPGLREQVDPRTGVTGINHVGWGDPAAVGCFAIDQGECALDAPFPSSQRFRVILRMRDDATMYLNGAIDNPIAFSEKIDGGHRFVIEAAPSPVLGLAGWIPKRQVPRGLIEAVMAEVSPQDWEVDFDRASPRPLSRGGEPSLAWLNALLPFLGDRASFIVDAWHVENTPTLGRYTSQCVNQGKGEFIGIVSSNATAYTGDPPIYNRATNTLRYEVAGPHYMPDGTTLSKGRYSINMNADFVKCILGVDKVPSQARVELIYPDGEASAATLAVKQDRNFLRLSYDNFTFSNPTVSVKFPKTLTCFKGKGKKTQSTKITGFECPKGWRPRR